MNDQLQAQLSQILAQIMISVGQVKDFSLKELPDIAQQYITYGTWASAIYTAVFGIVSIVCLIVGHKLLKRAMDDDDYFPLLVLPLVVFLFSTFGFFHYLHSLVLVLTAPKVWFILEIKNLLP